MTVYRTLLHCAIPALLLVAAGIAAPRIAELPAGLDGLRVYGVYTALAAALLISIAFKRGRALFALATLAAAYAGYRGYLQHDAPPALAYAVYAAMCYFVPVNFAVLALVRERGVFNRHGLLRSAVLAAELLATAWLALPGNTATVKWLYAAPLGGALMQATPLPQAAVALLAVCVLAGIAAGIITHTAIGLGLAGATAAFGLAADGITARGAFDAYIACGALILAVAVLQDTFRMAFRDETTGLPSRRALNERLAGLGSRYAIAMIDVDRFKGLNDNYGHDVGDQVLKMIAAKLARVRGGGSAYRYGGEEFTILFPGRSVDEAVPHLEALREEIAAHRLALRSGRRAPEKKTGGRPRTGAAGASVSVTISIGVAERGERLATPEAVIQAADKALYRAKNKGRNQLSR